MSGKSFNLKDETLTDMFQHQFSVQPIGPAVHANFTPCLDKMQIDLGHRDPLTGIDVHSRNGLAGIQK
jgi:hypothetical protein